MLIYNLSKLPAELFHLLVFIKLLFSQLLSSIFFGPDGKNRGNTNISIQQHSLKYLFRRKVSTSIVEKFFFEFYSISAGHALIAECRTWKAIRNVLYVTGALVQLALTIFQLRHCKLSESASMRSVLKAQFVIKVFVLILFPYHPLLSDFFMKKRSCMHDYTAVIYSVNMSPENTGNFGSYNFTLN